MKKLFLITFAACMVVGCTKTQHNRCDGLEDCPFFEKDGHLYIKKDGAHAVLCDHPSCRGGMSEQEKQAWDSVNRHLENQLKLIMKTPFPSK